MSLPTLTSHLTNLRQILTFREKSVMNSLRGALVVFEGVDRSGKSTQCRQLANALSENDIKCEIIRFPDRSTQIGQLIDSYLCQKENQLSDEVIHLLFSANRWELKKKMADLLTSGVTLIVDRYSYSGIAYSSIKKNMNIDWCKHPENGLLKPDVVFLLTLNKEALSQRPGYGQERYENDETQAKVARAMMSMAANERNWQIVDSSGTIDDIHSVIYEKTLQIIRNCMQKPLNFLKFS